MITCPSCGTSNPESSRFCTGCGQPLAIEPASGNSCAGCGAAIPADAKFCIACGRPVEAPILAGAARCPACGAEQDAGSQFCTQCGMSLLSPSIQPASPPTPSGESSLSHMAPAYLSLLESRLPQAGFQPLAASPGLAADRVWVRQRFELVMLNKVNAYCAVKWFAGPISTDTVRKYSETLYQYAQSRRSGFSKLTVQAQFILPVVVTNACPDASKDFLETYWPKHYMAYELPVIVVPAAKAMYCRQATPLWGMAFHGAMRKQAETLFAP